VRLDKSKGQIIFPRGRAFLLGSDVWSNMKLNQPWDADSVANLKKQWVSYGRELGKRMWVLMGKELDITFDVLEESASQAGWGVLKSEGDKAHGTHLRFVLSNCVFCQGLKGQFNQSCCYELSGTIQGLVEVLYGKRNVVEVKCASGVWDVCEVEVTE
jgi:predicted hydrocarbon binding protein